MNKLHDISVSAAGHVDPADLGRLSGLHQTMIEIAAIAKTVDYRPIDSFEFHSNIIAWAVEWEATFHCHLDAGVYHSDDWLEMTETFALAKLGEEQELCLRWMETDAGVPVLPSMDSILPAGPAVKEGDSFIHDSEGRNLASYGPRVLDGPGKLACVVPAGSRVPQFWGVYSHDKEGYATCVGDAVDEHSARAFAELIARPATTEASDHDGFKLPITVPFTASFKAVFQLLVEDARPSWIVGDFSDCEDKAEFDETLRDMIDSSCGTLGVALPDQVGDWIAGLYDITDELGYIWP